MIKQNPASGGVFYLPVFPYLSRPGIAVRRTASLPLAYDPAIHVFASRSRKQNECAGQARASQGRKFDAGRITTSADDASADDASDGDAIPNAGDASGGVANPNGGDDASPSDDHGRDGPSAPVQA